jgi:hypothetical protein
MTPISTKIVVLFVFIFSALFALTPTFAATLQLSKIGTLDASGKNYKEWWYTETNPVFLGTGVPNKEVTVTVDTNSYKVTTNAQ